MKELLPQQEIQDSLRMFLNFAPIVLIIIVVMAVFAFDIVKLDGTAIKNFKFYVLGISLLLGGIAYLFYPEGDTKITDIPSLIISCIVSLFVVQIVKYWRVKKNKK